MLHGMALSDSQTSNVLGAAIKRRRKELGLSIARASVAADIGTSTLVRAENSEPVGYDKIVRIARALDAAPADFYIDALGETAEAAPAPAWAIQQHEQVLAALKDLAKRLERIEGRL